MKWPSNVTVIAGLLAAVTLVTYTPAFKAEFVDYDDTDYVTQNPHVLPGLTKAGIVWAFTELHGEHTYWHPITWLSHMLDCQLFGLNAGAHHAVNVAFHTVNVVLLFLLLFRLTGTVGRSAVVAALFALHPLQVDTVAWVAERKNLLSTLFFLLTLWAYAGYVRNQPKAGERVDAAGVMVRARNFRLINYFLALVLFALALMSKPSVVTLPCVLLLLDYWPLQRLQLSELSTQRSTMVRLLLEKVPFFMLAAAVSVTTVLSNRQIGSISSSVDLPFTLRLTNALVSYGRYLRKAFWPDDLAVLYPYPKSWPVEQVLFTAVLLLGISAWVVWNWKRQPYLLMGWCWFVGMLVPTIGLIQAGAQSMANWFVYIPLIGLFLLITWGVADWRSRHPNQSALLIAVSTALLAGCFVVTRAQLRYWQNHVTLFERALAVTPPNFLALCGLGAALERAGRIEEATLRYRQALQFAPEHAIANYNLGNSLSKEKRYAEAVNYYERAIQSSPKSTEMHINLANALTELGQLTNAVRHYEIALEGKPGDAVAHNNLANVQVKLGRLEEAIQHYETALRLNANYAEAHNNLGAALVSLGRTEEAINHFQEALANQPDNAGLHHNLALAQLQANQVTQAVAHLRQALTFQPGLLIELNNHAWRLATHPEATVRDGPKAIVLANTALDYSGPQRAWVLDTLAAAYAEIGQFDSATDIARQALSLARAANDAALAEEITRRLALYRHAQPYREPPRK